MCDKTSLATTTVQGEATYSVAVNQLGFGSAVARDATDANGDVSCAMALPNSS